MKKILAIAICVLLLLNFNTEPTHANTLSADISENPVLGVFLSIAVGAGIMWHDLNAQMDYIEESIDNMPSSLRSQIDAELASPDGVIDLSYAQYQEFSSYMSSAFDLDALGLGNTATTTVFPKLSANVGSETVEFPANNMDATSRNIIFQRRFAPSEFMNYINDKYYLHVDMGNVVKKFAVKTENFRSVSGSRTATYAKFYFTTRAFDSNDASIEYQQTWIELDTRYQNLDPAGTNYKDKNIAEYMPFLITSWNLTEYLDIAPRDGGGISAYLVSETDITLYDGASFTLPQDFNAFKTYLTSTLRVDAGYAAAGIYPSSIASASTLAGSIDANGVLVDTEYMATGVDTLLQQIYNGNGTYDVVNTMTYVGAYDYPVDETVSLPYAQTGSASVYSGVTPDAMATDGLPADLANVSGLDITGRYNIQFLVNGYNRLLALKDADSSIPLKVTFSMRALWDAVANNMRYFRASYPFPQDEYTLFDLVYLDQWQFLGVPVRQYLRMIIAYSMYLSTGIWAYGKLREGV